MATKRKELYLGKSMKDLNAIAEKKNVKKVPNESCRMYTKSAEKVYQNAVDAQLIDKDDEKAFVLFMTFLSITSAIRKTQEYKKSKNYYDDMLLKKTLKAMDEAETLADSLKKRYEEKEAEAIVNKLDILSAKPKEPAVEDKSDAKLIDSETDTVKPPDVPPDQPLGTEKGMISPSKLYELLTDNGTRVLIMDVRNEQDFHASHIMHRTCINVPPSAVKPGCLAQAIESKLSTDSREMWQSRDKVDFIVIVNWISSPECFETTHVVLNLKNAIFKWEQEVIIKSEPLLLEGGYQDWLSMYPTMTTNPHVQHPNKKIVVENTVTLEQISYDVDLNFLNPPEEMKPPPVQTFTNGAHQPPAGVNNIPQAGSRPQIPDRSLKAKINSTGPQVEGALSAAMKPDANEAEKVRLAQLQREEKEEEERLASAQQRLAAELEAEQKQKEIDEERRKLDEKEKELVEKLKRETEKHKLVEAHKAEQQRLLEVKRKEQEQEQIRKEQELKNKEEKERIVREKKKHEAEEAERRRKAEIAKMAEIDQIKAEKAEREKRAREQAEHEKRAREKAERELKLKEQVEKEKAEKILAENRKKEEEIKKSLSVARTSLPSGWDVRFDEQTNKIFYVNHITKETQWHAPTATQSAVPKPAPRTSLMTDAAPKVYKTSLRDEPRSGGGFGGGGLKRSSSSPNVAKMVADEEQREHGDQRSLMPSVNRGAKPRINDTLQFVNASKAKLRHFDGVWGNVGQGRTGLKNMGNTCYMNSTLQCLSNTAYLTAYLISDDYIPDINRENKMGTGGDIALEYAALVKTLWSAQYRSITPRDFKYAVARHNSMFDGYQQQDSQEFLLTLLDSLHEDLNKIRNRPTLPEQKNDGIDEERAGDNAWKMHKTVHDSVLVELFQGQYKSTVMCKTCGKKSVTFDTFMYLSLDIHSQSKCSLDECLQHFSKEEQMQGDSRWNCPACRVKRDAVKRIVIWKLPPIVIIVLKRFYFKGQWRQKIGTAVEFPLEGLNLSRYISGPQKRKPYDLYAVSNHYGTMEGGHYTACCKSPNNGKWYKFDDHEVHECSKSSIKSPAAYFLFYSSMSNRFQ